VNAPIKRGLLPLSVCDMIDRKCRSFIWGDFERVRKVHTIPWRKVCTPKNDEGLGMRLTRDFLRKFGWKLMPKKPSLWATLIRGKYKCGAGVLPKVQKRISESNFWRGLCKSWNDLQNQVSWRVGNGLETDFWSHDWIPFIGPVVDKATIYLSNADKEAKVFDFTKQNGGWNEEKLCVVLDSNICFIILCLPPPRVSNHVDIPVWKACD